MSSTSTSQNPYNLGQSEMEHKKLSPHDHHNSSQRPVISTLKELIAHLRQIFDSDDVDVELVKAVMRSYKSNPQDWRQYAKFDEYRYTRNLVDEGNGKYNLMILCWGEGHGSAIHDHSDAHCFMKILQGTLSEVRYSWPEENNEGTQKNEDDEPEEMKVTSRTQLDLNGVCYMSDELGLHRVENPSHTQPAVSLHLYCPPFSSCNMFDQRTGRKTKCQVTFWSKYGDKVEYNTSTTTTK